VVTQLGLGAIGLLFAILNDRRTSSPEGLQRLRERDPYDASRLRSAYRETSVLGLMRGGAVVLAVIGLASLVRSDWPTTAIALVTAALAAYAARTRVRAAERILAVLAERDLPVTDPDTSRRGRRRVKQLGVAGAVSYLVGTVLALLGDARELGALVAVGGALMVLALVLFLAMAWAGVWRYGDEQPARTD
jgi:hypothetical protein